MRGTLAAHEITKSHGAETILDGVSLTVSAGARVGVLGPNGIGKSTLLRVLAGVEAPDAGTVVRDGEVGFLPQETDAADDETLLAYLARRTGVDAAEREMDALAARLGDEPELAEAYAEALDRYLALGGADFEARAAATCAEVGLAIALDRPLGRVSGGQAARARLAAILLARFDCFLLDEPTNDLDFAGLELLERFVAGVRGSVVLVSHDRAFLERTVDRIVELEAETRRVREYAGGFGEYERMRAAARAAQEARWERWSEERERFSSLHTERRTQARAGGRQADRRGTHALSSKVRAAERRLERLDRERPEVPWNPWRLQLELDAGSRGGELVVELRGAVVERGGSDGCVTSHHSASDVGVHSHHSPFRLGPIDLVLRRGERLAVVGPNGSGKSTLLGALTGDLPLAAGTRRVGPGTRIARLDQERSLFAGAEPLLEPFRRASGLAPAEARNLLGRFALRGDAVLRPARSLSPGERTRALVALLAARGANALVLDEPTNHLDLEAIEELEGALRGFEGAVVLVTHDRRLLAAFAPDDTVDLGASYFGSA